MKKSNVFESKKFTPEMLENELWDVLRGVRTKRLKPAEANSVIFAAKEICAIARLRLQYKILEGPTLSELRTGRPDRQTIKGIVSQ